MWNSYNIIDILWFILKHLYFILVYRGIVTVDSREVCVLDMLCIVFLGAFAVEK